MPIKPDQIVLGAAEVMRNDPEYSRHCLEAVINETPELRDALLKMGLVKEVTYA